ncbi:hypothetical protein AGABI1DRAFT_133314 [Agaricus bisporus var. burnettii JB137-S8]|uniref:Uncharacterized protein n=1 Tax=Agaricus bisporus var. burnettii (strain JB137-S8 / ATCC MYA-4627 / FGSC 10392) TaxID=597362 RepID=K5XIW5_AGABU|nr:uncharacterized protein AGABI1DRAFT_133314 [Agaricus bisporus var. burnettii JB137-S8]EKM74395.1 hypothetical protein AGABI1DRAFT_133314 [Agaricus bisporus var. burnettii JB137-S8]
MPKPSQNTEDIKGKGKQREMVKPVKQATGHLSSSHSPTSMPHARALMLPAFHDSHSVGLAFPGLPAFSQYRTRLPTPLWLPLLE